MNDRLVTLSGALVSLLVLITVLYGPSQPVQTSRPTSEQAGRNGYLGLKRWLDYAGIATLSYRHRMDDLTGNTRLERAGNVMISTMPHRKPFRSDEREQLRTWMAQGNTLLLLAALDDSPDWIFRINSLTFLEELAALTGITFEAITDEDGDVIIFGDMLSETEVMLQPVVVHPLLEGLSGLQGVSDSTSSIWRPRLQDSPAFVARMATEAETQTDAMWQMPIGEGFLIVSGSASLLSNRMLGKADNARFFARLLAYHLGSGGAVVFDDIHQGLSEIYDPEAFFADERLHVSVYFLLGFWLIYLLGTSGRLQAASEAPAPPRQGELVRAIGGFMTRKLSRAEAGRLMVEGWFQELERAGRIQPGNGTPWQQLEAMPLVQAELLNEIRRDYGRLGQGKKVDLKKLHNRLLDLKRTLA